MSRAEQQALLEPESTVPTSAGALAELATLVSERPVSAAADLKQEAEEEEEEDEDASFGLHTDGAIRGDATGIVVEENEEDMRLLGPRTIAHQRNAALTRQHFADRVYYAMNSVGRDGDYNTYHHKIDNEEEHKNNKKKPAAHGCDCLLTRSTMMHGTAKQNDMLWTEISRLYRQKSSLQAHVLKQERAQLKAAFAPSHEQPSVFAKDGTVDLDAEEEEKTNNNNNVVVDPLGQYDAQSLGALQEELRRMQNEHDDGIASDSTCLFRARELIMNNDDNNDKYLIVAHDTQLIGGRMTRAELKQAAALDPDSVRVTRLQHALAYLQVVHARALKSDDTAMLQLIASLVNVGLRAPADDADKTSRRKHNLWRAIDNKETLRNIGSPEMTKLLRKRSAAARRSKQQQQEESTVRNPMILCTRRGECYMMAVLTMLGARLDGQSARAGELGQTALMAATHFGQVRAVKLLLRLGASPGALNDIHETALTVAASVGEVEIARILKKEDYLLGSHDCFGDSALNKATRCAHWRVVRVLSSSSSSDSDKKNALRSAELTLEPAAVASAAAAATPPTVVVVPESPQEDLLQTPSPSKHNMWRAVDTKRTLRHMSPSPSGGPVMATEEEEEEEEDEDAEEEEKEKEVRATTPVQLGLASVVDAENKQLRSPSPAGTTTAAARTPGNDEKTGGFSLTLCCRFIFGFLAAYEHPDAQAINASEFVTMVQHRWLMVDLDRNGAVSYDEIRHAVWQREEDEDIKGGAVLPPRSEPLHENLQSVVDHIWGARSDDAMRCVTFFDFTNYMLLIVESVTSFSIPVPNELWAQSPQEEEK
jgi:hypothetical protein